MLVKVATGVPADKQPQRLFNALSLPNGTPHATLFARIMIRAPQRSIFSVEFRSRSS